MEIFRKSQTQKMYFYIREVLSKIHPSPLKKWGYLTNDIDVEKFES